MRETHLLEFTLNLIAQQKRILEKAKFKLILASTMMNHENRNIEKVQLENKVCISEKIEWDIKL